MSILIIGDLNFKEPFEVTSRVHLFLESIEYKRTTLSSFLKVTFTGYTFRDNTDLHKERQLLLEAADRLDSFDNVKDTESHYLRRVENSIGKLMITCLIDTDTPE